MRLLYLFLFLVPLFGSAQRYYPPRPQEFSNYAIDHLDTNVQAWYTSSPFFVPQGNTPTTYNPALAIYDPSGYLKWYATTTVGRFFDFKYYPQKQLFSYALRTGFNQGTFYVMDTSFSLVDSIVPPAGFRTDIHEFIILDNGNYLISGATDSIVDLSDTIFNGVRGSDSTSLLAFTLHVFDSASHQLLFQWNSNDHIDPLESYWQNYGYDSSRFDYCHGNSIEQDTDGHYLVSLRHTNSVYKVHGQSGQTIWRLGGKVNSFTFVNDAGFSGQHDVRRLPNGNISIYDNGNMNSPQISRAVEYQLDTVNWTATKVWEYVHQPAFYAFAMGSYQRFGNNEGLINYGLHYSNGPNMLSLDSNSNPAFEFRYLDTMVSYRGQAYPNGIPLPTVSVQCDNQNGILTLTASGGSRYRWSTGDSLASITPVSADTFQVWVNKGIGMLGSEPIIVDNLSNYCVDTFLDENRLPKKPARLIGVYDLMGREVNHPKPYQVYLLRYSDGTSTKILWTQP